MFGASRFRSGGLGIRAPVGMLAVCVACASGRVSPALAPADDTSAGGDRGACARDDSTEADASLVEQSAPTDIAVDGAEEVADDEDGITPFAFRERVATITHAPGSDATRVVFASDVGAAHALTLHAGDAYRVPFAVGDTLDVDVTRVTLRDHYEQDVYRSAVRIADATGRLLIASGAAAPRDWVLGPLVMDGSPSALEHEGRRACSYDGTWRSLSTPDGSWLVMVFLSSYVAMYNPAIEPRVIIARVPPS